MRTFPVCNSNNLCLNAGFCAGVSIDSTAPEFHCVEGVVLLSCDRVVRSYRKCNLIGWPDLEVGVSRTSEGEREEEENRKDKDEREKEEESIPLGLKFQHAHGMRLRDNHALEGIRGWFGAIARTEYMGGEWKERKRKEKKSKERKTKRKEKDSRKNRRRRRSSIYLGGSAVVRWQTTCMFEDVIVRELWRHKRGGRGRIRLVIVLQWVSITANACKEKE